MDGIELEIVWSNLISIVSEQAKAMQRIAFSPIVREAGDLANALFDRRGRMVAQAVTGTPGHINSLAAAGKHFVEAFPTQTLEEGDVLITNDPWLSAGHFFDITVLVPAFHKGKLVAYFGSTIHHTDIGGYGVGAGARDVHEEGLWIPMLKLYERGEPNAGAARDHPPQRAARRTKCSAISQLRCRAASSPASASRRCSTGKAMTISSNCPTRSSRAPRPRRARRSASSKPAPITARARSTCRAATSSR
jgi:N-methylhydantoinase B